MKAVGDNRQDILNKYWGVFLEWSRSEPKDRTSNMPYLGGSRIDNLGYQITKNWATMPTNDNFWLWYTEYKLTPTRPLKKQGGKK